MLQPIFGKAQLVIYRSGIYEIKEVIFDQDPPTYQIILVGYLEGSSGGIEIDLPKETTALESELQKFAYGQPRYRMGARLGGGGEVYLVVFKYLQHQYRYNIKDQNAIFANLADDDLRWR